MNKLTPAQREVLKAMAQGQQVAIVAGSAFLFDEDNASDEIGEAVYRPLVDNGLVVEEYGFVGRWAKLTPAGRAAAEEAQ